MNDMYEPMYQDAYDDSSLADPSPVTSIATSRSGAITMLQSYIKAGMVTQHEAMDILHRFRDPAPDEFREGGIFFCSEDSTK